MPDFDQHNPRIQVGNTDGDHGWVEILGLTQPGKIVVVRAFCSTCEHTKPWERRHTFNTSVSVTQGEVSAAGMDLLGKLKQHLVEHARH